MSQIPDDIAADLPAPRDDEPESLRRDIVDELADHLQCALHRELLASGQASPRRQSGDTESDPIARQHPQTDVWGSPMVWDEPTAEDVERPRPNENRASR